MTNETDSWDKYLSGNFLKAINVSGENHAFVCTDVGTFERKPTTPDAEVVKGIRLTLESNGQEYDFDLNKTNAKKIKDLGVAAPKDCLGKTFFFKKALVRSPKTNQEVEGLRIYKIA